MVVPHFGHFSSGGVIVGISISNRVDEFRAGHLSFGVGKSLLHLLKMVVRNVTLFVCLRQIFQALKAENLLPRGRCPKPRRSKAGTNPNRLTRYAHQFLTRVYPDLILNVSRIPGSPYWFSLRQVLAANNLPAIRLKLSALTPNNEERVSLANSVPVVELLRASLDVSEISAIFISQIIGPFWLSWLGYSRQKFSSLKTAFSRQPRGYGVLRARG